MKIAHVRLFHSLTEETHSGFLSDIVIIKQKNIVNPAAITTHVPFLSIATDLEQVM